MKKKILSIILSMSMVMTMVVGVNPEIGFAADTTTTVMTWAELLSAVNAAPTDGSVTTIIVGADLVADSYCHISNAQKIVIENESGKNYTITLAKGFERMIIGNNGGNLTLKNITLDGNGENVTATQHMIFMWSGELTMDAATIQNVKATVDSGPAGVQIASGTLTLKNNSVIKNVKNRDSIGAVYIGNGTMNMMDSSITDCTASYYGGVVIESKATLNMSGVSAIKGNIGQSGNYINGTFNLSGAPDISGNKKADKSTECNLYLRKSVINIAGPLSISTPIGITTQTSPNLGAPINITTNSALDLSSYFKSDNPKYVIKNSGTGNSQVVQLSADITPVSPFVFDTATKTITDYSGPGGEIIIPDMINGVAVENIGDGAFKVKELTSVVIPDSVKKIGNNAFDGNIIHTLSLGNSVTSIGDVAFYHNKITSLTLGNSIKTIGGWAFNGNDITSLTLGNSVENIGEAAFYDNKQLTSITINSPTTTLGDSLLGRNNNFKEAYTSGGVGTYRGTQDGPWTKIPLFSFNPATKTINGYSGPAGAVVIPSTINGTAVENIGNAAFQNKGITSVVVPDSVKTIGEGAFHDNNISALTLGSGVQTIGTDAFSVNKLQTVSIPNSVTSIGQEAFCNNEIASLNLGSGVKTIGVAAFYENKLTAITLPSTVTSIDELAFQNNQLTSITMNGTNTTLGDDVLADSNNNFKTAYVSGGVGTYAGTQDGKWTKVVTLTNADKVALAKTAMSNALNALTSSNATTAQELLNAANGNTLHGVVAAWDNASGFTKTNATTTVDGSITGTLNLTLGGTTVKLVINKPIPKLPAPPTPGGGSNGGSGSSQGSSSGDKKDPKPVVDPKPIDSTKPVNIIVDGTPFDAAKESTTIDKNGMKEVAVAVNKEMVAAKVDEAKKLAPKAKEVVVEIPTSQPNADKLTGVLTGDLVKNMEGKQVVLSIKTDMGEYRLPASQIDIDAVANALGKNVELKDIQVRVAVSNATTAQNQAIAEIAKKQSVQVIGGGASFEVSATNNGRTVDVNRFTNYVERLLPVEGNRDITTAAVVDGSNLVQVPTEIVVIKGKKFAKVNSLTNSTYVLVYAPKVFADLKGHKYEKAVNEMASRLVVSGETATTFSPNHKVTRGEGIEIITKALGVYRDTHSKSNFTDSASGKVAASIDSASAYRLIAGKGMNKFDGSGAMTLEQLCSILAKANTYTRVTLSDKQVGTNASKYAQKSVSQMVNLGIFSAKDDFKRTATKAEVTNAVYQLLVKGGLINR